MSPRRRRRIGPLALVLALLTGAGACGPGVRQPRRDGERVRVARLHAAEAGSPGRRGDWTIQSPLLRAVFGGPERDAPRNRGALLAVAPGAHGGEDHLDGVQTLVVFEGATIPLEPTRVRALRIHDRWALRFSGVVDLGVPTVFTRTVEVRGHATLQVTTRVATAEDIQLVERVRWGGATPFAPSLGSVSGTHEGSVPWVGHEGRGRSIVLGFIGGNTSLRGEVRRHGRHSFLRYTDLLGPAPRGPSPREWTSLISCRAGGLSEAVREFGQAIGTPYPEAALVLQNATDDASIRVEGPDGTPWLRTRPTPGARSTRIPLASTEAATAWVTAFGHEATRRVPIAPGDTTTLTVPASGEVRFVVRDAEAGRRIPARVRLRSLEGMNAPSLGPVWDASGAGDTAVTADWTLSIRAPLGRYEAVFSHGPEWSIVTRPVTFAGPEPRDVEVALDREVRADRWVPSDLHLHAAPSPDSQVSLEDRVRTLVAEGIRFAVPTDHNAVTHYGPAAESLGLDGFLTVPGVEVSTWEPQFGHFNVFPYRVADDEPYGGPPRYQALTPAQLFANLRRGSPESLIQVNHPRLEPLGIGYFDVTEYTPGETNRHGYSADYDSIEVWNGFDLARLERVQRNLAEWMRMLAAGERHVATGSSDSHTVNTEQAGYPRTYVYAPEGAPVDALTLVESLRQGRAFVTNGPLITASVGDMGVGDSVDVAGPRARVRVQVRSAAWVDVDRVEVYVGGALAEAHTLSARERSQRHAGGLLVDRSFDVAVPRSTFVVIVARGSTPMRDLFTRAGVLPFAFTNPIWLNRRP